MRSFSVAVQYSRRPSLLITDPTYWPMSPPLSLQGPVNHGAALNSSVPAMYLRRSAGKVSGSFFAVVVAVDPPPGTGAGTASGCAAAGHANPTAAMTATAIVNRILRHIAGRPFIS
jgi:hypothetical protein